MSTTEDAGLTLTRTGDHHLVAIGEIDLATMALLERTVQAFPRHEQIIIDLAGVSFIDSTGLGALVRLRHDGFQLVIDNPSPSVVRLLELTGLSMLSRQPVADEA